MQGVSNGPVPPVRRGGNVFAIWLVAMAAFVAGYSVVIRWTGPISTAWVLVFLGGSVIIGFAAYLTWLMHCAGKFTRDNNDAMAAQGRGDLGRATRVYESWSRRRVPRLVSATARHNHGWALIRQGKLREAVDLLSANDREARNADLRSASATDIALCWALLGEIATAEAWIAEAVQRLNIAAQPSSAASLAFARAVIACRAGIYDEANRIFDERWAEFESTAPGGVVRPMRIVHAFAAGAGAPRNAGIAERKLEQMRPAYPDEFTFMAVAWPELATFLAAHKLDGSN